MSDPTSPSPAPSESLCHYDHHKEDDGTPTKGTAIWCPKCKGPLTCGPFMHACRKCDPLNFGRCGICGTIRVSCCC